MPSSSALITVLSLTSVGAALGFANYRKTPKHFRPIIFYLAYTFLAEIANYLMAKYLRNNMPGYHVGIPIELLILMVFFYRNIDNEKIYRFIPWMTGILILLSLLNTLFLQPFNTMPDNISKVFPMIIIAFTAYLFFEKLETAGKNNIFKDPGFIATIAFLWFNIISFLFFLFYPFFTRHYISTVEISKIHYASNIVFYSILCYAMIVNINSNKHVSKLYK